MATFEIRKKTTTIWEHNWLDTPNQNLILSSGYYAMVGDDYELYTDSGGNIRKAELSEIILYDDTDSSTPETFTDPLVFINRLVALDYPYSDGSGDSSGSDPTFTTLTEGQVPKANSSGKLIYGGATVDPTSEEWTFDQSINVPSGSIKIGEVLQLSEGLGDLISINLLNDEMKLSAKSVFDDVTGAAIPTYTKYGSAVVEVLQPDFSEVITTNPLIFPSTSTVLPPDRRLTDIFILKADSAMTNFRIKVTDDATGLVIRYFPSKAAYDGVEAGLDLIAGDNTFYLTSDAASTPGNFHLGFIPFITEANQLVEIEFIADTMAILGDALDNPYISIRVHDGPVVTLAEQDDASPGGVDTNIQFNDGGTFGGATEFTYVATTDITNVSIHSPTAIGQGNLNFRDNIGGLQGIVRYDELNDVFRVITLSGVDIEFAPGAGANVGIGTSNPISNLHLYENNALTDNTNGLTIEQEGVGDVSIHLLITGGEEWTIAIDQSDAERLKIAQNADAGSAPVIDFSTSDINFLSGRTNLANTGTTTFLTMDSPTATGLVGILFHDNLDALHGSLAYNFSLDQLQINSVIGGINLFTGLGLTKTNTSSASQNYNRLVSGGTSCVAGFQVENTGSTIDLEMIYNQGTDRSYLIDRSASGLEVEAINGVLFLKSATDDILLDVSSNAGRIEILGLNHTDSHSILNIATSDGEVDFYVGEDTPVGSVSAVGGSIYFRDAETDSAIFVKKSAGAASTSGWTEVGGGGSGDVVGPASSITNSIAIFDDTSGKSIDDFPQITTTTSSDDRFLNIDMAVSFDGEVGLRIRNELGVDKTTLSYEGNNEETYFNTYGSGGLIATIAAGDCVYQMSGAAANFKINGTTSPDTSDVFSVVAGGTNGGSANFLVGSRNPEGNANKAFGHFYWRTDGVNTGLYAKKSAGVSTTDWYPYPTAPQTTVTNAIATFEGATGDSLLSVDTAQVSASATSTTMELDTVTSAGIAALAFRNAASASRLILEYSETADRSILSDLSANGFRMSASSGDFDFETSASALAINANVPTAAGNAGFVINDFVDAQRFSVKYDDNSNACTVDLNSDLTLTTTASESAVTILSPSGTGDAKLAFETNTGSEAFAIRYLQTSDVVQALTNKNTTFSNITASGTFTFSHGVTGQTLFETTGANTNAPISFESVGANGSTAELYLSAVLPQNAITSANAGDLCIYSEEDNPRLHISGTGGATNNDWYFMPAVYAGDSETLTLNSNTATSSAALVLKSNTGGRQISLQYDDNTGDALLEMAAPNGAEINSPLSFLLLHADDDEVRIRRGDTGVTGEILNIQNSTTDFGIWADTQTPIGNATGSPGDLHVEVNGVDSNLYVHDGASSNSANWVGCKGGSSILVFGDASIATNTVTRYLTPGHDSGTAQTAPIYMVAPRDGFIKNLYVRHNTPQGNGNDVVYTARLDSVATALTVTLASTGSQASDTTNIVAVTAGELIDIAVTKASSIVTSPSNVQVSLEYL